MKKDIQKEINAKVLDMVNEFNKGFTVLEYPSRLRSCSAYVHTRMLKDTGEFIYALQSYSTIIAIISGNCLYDFLRYTYGYTATSAQHIAKFRNDYMTRYSYNDRHEYRYYHIYE